MDGQRTFLIQEFDNKEAREQYAEELLDSYIALQIKTLRLQRDWSQEELAQRSGKHQSQISAMEQIDFQSWKISSLRQVAQAFDLALVVRFESYGRFLDEVLPVERDALERLSFSDDPVFQTGSPALAASRTPSSDKILEFRGPRAEFETRPGASTTLSPESWKWQQHG